MILKFYGKVIDKMRDLPRIVAETDIGSKVEVELFRQGKKKIVIVELGELEKAELVGLVDSDSDSGPGDKQSFGSLGMSVQDLDAKLAEELGIDPELTGVVVVDVIPGSPAVDKGLAPGDIIRRYGQRRVDDALALAKDIKVAENGGKSGILILVERDGRERFVQICFAEKTE